MEVDWIRAGRLGRVSMRGGCLFGFGAVLAVLVVTEAVLALVEMEMVVAFLTISVRKS